MERRQNAGNTVTALNSRLEEALAVAGDLTVRQAEEILAGTERELEALTGAASTEEALAGRWSASPPSWTKPGREPRRSPGGWPKTVCAGRDGGPSTTG
ncbi:hypothetical protein ACFQX6_63430 [Streptosporangium lutulentum]